MLESDIELAAALVLACEAAAGDDAIALIAELARRDVVLLEVILDRREHLARHRVAAVVGARRRVASAGLVPLDLRVEGLEDGGDIALGERVVGAANHLHILLGHTSLLWSGGFR